MSLFTDKYGDYRWGVIWTFIAIAALAGSCKACHVVNGWDYSQGQRVGVINKASEKGLIWKTYEGEMALEGIVGGNSVGANIWDFSIDRQKRNGENPQELFDKLNEAINKQQKVKIKYKQSFLYWPPRGGTTYYIQSVEPLVDSIKK